MSNTGFQYKQELSRSLRLIDLVFYGIVLMSPTAIFAVYGFVRDASQGTVVLAYIIGCAAMMLTGLSYAAMANSVPVAGSVYHYARASMGRSLGFIGGWAILLDYLLIPALMILLGGMFMNGAFPAIPVEAWILIFLAIATVVNFLGIKLTSIADTIISVILLIVVALFLIGGFIALFGGAGAGGLTWTPISPEGGISMSLAVSGASVAVLTYLGFDAISTLAEEVTGGDSKAVGQATVSCLLIMGTLYIVVAWLLTDLSAGMTIKDMGQAAFEIIEARVPWLSYPVLLAVGLGTGIGSAIPPQAAVSRILFAMARDRQLPGPLALVHRKYQTPYVAVLFIAVLMAVVALGFVAHLDLLFNLVNFGALVAFLFVNASVIMFHGVQRQSGNVLRHWVLPGLGFAVTGYVLSGLAQNALTIGVIWLAIGIAYYLVLRVALGRTGDLALNTKE